MHRYTIIFDVALTCPAMLYRNNSEQNLFKMTLGHQGKNFVQNDIGTPRQEFVQNDIGTSRIRRHYNPMTKECLALHLVIFC